MKNEKMNQLRIISVRDLYRASRKKTEWLVEGLIPARTITMIGGKPECGKTWLLLHLARSIASGQKLFGYFPVTQGKILFIEQEDSAEYLGQRVRTLGIKRKNKSIYFIVQSKLKVEDEKDMVQIIEFVKKNKIKVVMIDSFVRIHRQDENSSGGSAAVFEAIKRLQEFCTVILIHHFRKGVNAENQTSKDGEQLRGSSDIYASVDVLLTVSLNEKVITITQAKMRVADKIKPFEIEVVENDGFELVYRGSTYGTSVKNIELFIDYMKQRKELSRKEILNYMKMNGMGLNAIDVLLRELVKDKKLKKIKGSTNQDIYTLIN